MQKERFNREIVAMRVARELQDGDVVNLGDRDTDIVLAVHSRGEKRGVPQRERRAGLRAYGGTR